MDVMVLARVLFGMTLIMSSDCDNDHCVALFQRNSRSQGLQPAAAAEDKLPQPAAAAEDELLQPAAAEDELLQRVAAEKELPQPAEDKLPQPAAAAEDGKEVIISIGHSSHQVGYTKGFSLPRLNWQIATRCIAEQCETCESSAYKPKNCWFGFTSGLGLKVDQSSTFSTFKSITHISCHAPNPIVQFQLRRARHRNNWQGGTVQLFLDDKQVATFHEDDDIEGFERFKIQREVTDPRCEGKGLLRMRADGSRVRRSPKDRGLSVVCELPEGSYTVKLQFTKAPASQSTGKKIKVSVRSLQFIVDQGFESCVDMKLCLTHLSDKSHLRIDNAEQLACLEGRRWVKGGECRSWRKCMWTAANNSKTTESNLRTFLRATNPKNVSMGLIQRNVKQDVSECIDPYTADSLEWHCDCYPAMKQRCQNWEDDEQDLCMTALICLHTPQVCQQWRDDNCDNEQVKEMKNQLGALLLERSSHTSGVKSLEEVVCNKSGP